MNNADLAKPEEEWVWIRMKDAAFSKVFLAPRNKYELHFDFEKKQVELNNILLP